MKNLKIKDIVKATKGELIVGNKEAICKKYSKDTRTIKSGDCYIGIKGESFDGNLFWEKALENGADTVVIQGVEFTEQDKTKWKNKNIIKVQDTMEALYSIARAKRELYDIPVIAITGSVGKTSTKDMIYSVLSQKYKTLKTEGNFNNDIGLPLTILKLREHEVAVIEMGMNHKREISKLTKIAKPQLAVITNVGTAHIGNLGSRENILNAKLEILEGMQKPKIVINNDNDLLHEWKNNLKENIEVHTFGIENKSDCMAENIKKSENNSEFICNINNEKIKINVPIGGDVFIINSLCAILVGKNLGLSDKQIQDGIENFELTKKRMEIIKLKNNITLINDSYNASLDSMKASIKYLSELKGKRKIAVLGDLFELGDYSEKIHRKIGEEIVKNKIDLLYLIGENSKYIKDEALKNGMNKNNIFYFNSKNEIINNLKNIMTENDIVLFKASNGMRLFEIVEELKKD